MQAVDYAVLAGMQTAIMHWPRVLAPDGVIDDANQDYANWIESAEARAALPLRTWVEGYARGYDVQVKLLGATLGSPLR